MNRACCNTAVHDYLLFQLSLFSLTSCWSNVCGMILRNRKEKKNLREDAPLWKIVSKKTGLTQSREAGLSPSSSISNVILQ
jgi:hypothetical protein